MTKMNIKIEACLTAISQKEYHQIQAEVSKIQELLEKGCNVDGQIRWRYASSCDIE